MKGKVTHTVQAFRRKYDTTLLLALFTPLQFRCHLWMKEIEQAAAVLGGSPQTVDRRNFRNRVSRVRQDYFTVLDICA